MANKFELYNNYESELADTLLIAGTTANVVSAGDLATPASGFTLRATITNQEQTLREIIGITAVSGTAFTIVRAQEGTTAREWPGGSIIYVDFTEGIFSTLLQGLDTGGDAKGTNALEIQTGRSGDTEVASGDYSVTLGYGNTASGDYAYSFGYNNVVSGNYSVGIGYNNTVAGAYAVASGHSAVAEEDYAIAIGYQAAVTDPQTETAWAATTAYSSGAYRKVAASDNYLLKCVVGGTSGGTEPTVSGSSGMVTDGTVIWEIIRVNANSDGGIAVGNTSDAVGVQASAYGDGAKAYGQRAIAVGGNATADGYDALAIGGNARGLNAISIRGGNLVDDGRNADYMTMVGGYKYAPFKYCGNFGGIEFIDQHDWWYVDNTGDDYETAVQITRKMTFYSIPIQLGNAGHPGTSQTVKHGYSIVSGSHIYTAYCYNGDYLDEGTTAGSTPTLTTTIGDSTSDGTVDWICVMPAGGTLEKLLPDYARFTPTSVGAVARSCTPGGSATYPQLTFGVNGDLDSWLAATTHSKLTGDFSNHMTAPTATEGAKQFGVDIDTAGTDLDCVAVIVWEGYVIESQTA